MQQLIVNIFSHNCKYKKDCKLDFPSVLEIRDCEKPGKILIIEKNKVI